jgi:integrase
MVTVQFYLHTPKRKQSPLYVRVHPGDLRRSVGILLKPGEWNHQKQRVKGHDYTTELNNLLTDIEGRVHKAAIEARINGGVFTVEMLEQILRPGKVPKVEPETPGKVYEAWKVAYLEEKNLGNTGESKGNNYTRSFKPTVDHLEKFRPGLLFTDLLKEEVIKEFRRYLVKAGLEDSSVAKQLKNIRALLKFKGHSTGHVATPKLFKTTHYALTWKELQLLREFEYKSIEQRKAADVFLIASQICLRYSDLLNLTPGHIVTLAGKTKAVNLSQGKTGDTVHIPFPAMASGIMEQYGWVLPVSGYSDNSSNFNKHLKAAAKAAGLTRQIRITSVTGGHIKEEWRPLHELISIHDARHTGASLVTEASGEQMLGEALLGHAAASIYIHGNTRLIANKLLETWGKIEQTKESKR